MLTMEIVLLVLIAAGVIVAYLSGKRQAQFLEREKALLSREDLRERISSLESQNRDLCNELEISVRKAEKYNYFLGRLPQAVKQINSNLSFEQLTTAMVRLTKDLTGTNVVEIYVFNRSSRRLRLVAAYGADRENGIEVMPGEGLVGKAAELKTIMARGQQGGDVSTSGQEEIDTAIPILFKDVLHGVIAIGAMQDYTGNEKRFLAMLSDLMALALNSISEMAGAGRDATKDVLTGLYNRDFFLEKAKEALLSSEGYDFPVSVLIFDIDHFRNYNDTNGHAQGDVVLRDIGRLLREHTRSTNTVARYDGEEFILLLENVGGSIALRIAENIRKLVESYPFPYRAKQPLGCISVSGGIAIFPSDGKTVHELIKHADEALSVSKNAGGNRVTIYDPQQFPYIQ